VTQVGGYQAAPVDPEPVEEDRRKVRPVERLAGDDGEVALAG